MKKQLRSFGYAFKGIGRSICTESHLRFHLVAAFYVIIFSMFYSFSATQYAVLILLIAVVIALELINTAIENVCDLVTTNQNAHIKTAKDAAAGAVLTVSVAAAVTAVLFFVDMNGIKSAYRFFAGNPVMLVLLIVSAAVSAVFVIPGPARIFNRIRKNQKE